MNDHTMPDTRETPWGTAYDDGDNIAPGIRRYDTPGHGGFRISPEREALLPKGFRKGLWYEEDCKWAILCYFFDDFPQASRAQAIATLKHSYPYEWEAHTGDTIPPGESLKKDQDQHRAAHQADYMVTAATGSSADWVPQGYVGVYARLGGRPNQAGKSCRFLVPAAEYKGRSPGLDFVVDPTRHQQVD
jgi:hypothetical protein